MWPQKTKIEINPLELADFRQAIADLNQLKRQIARLPVHPNEAAVNTAVSKCLEIERRVVNFISITTERVLAIENQNKAILMRLHQYDDILRAFGVRMTPRSGDGSVAPAIPKKKRNA